MSIALLETFIARYKDTYYADLARVRIEDIKKRLTSAPVPITPPVVVTPPAASAPPPAVVHSPRPDYSQQPPSPQPETPVQAGLGEKVCRVKLKYSGEVKTWVCKQDEPCCVWHEFSYVKCGSATTGCL